MKTQTLPAPSPSPPSSSPSSTSFIKLTGGCNKLKSPDTLYRRALFIFFCFMGVSYDIRGVGMYAAALATLLLYEQVLHKFNETITRKQNVKIAEKSTNTHFVFLLSFLSSFSSCSLLLSNNSYLDSFLNCSFFNESTCCSSSSSVNFFKEDRKKILITVTYVLRASSFFNYSPPFLLLPFLTFFFYDNSNNKIIIMLFYYY